MLSAIIDASLFFKNIVIQTSSYFYVLHSYMYPECAEIYYEKDTELFIG